MAANTALDWTGTDTNETQEGGARNDYLDGKGGDDLLSGGGGNDTVKGGEGNDYLIGGGHDDLLIGGLGDDSLNGGGGSDIYRFNLTLTQTAVAETFMDGKVPLADGAYSSNANGLWNSYLDALGEWREVMTTTWGADANTDSQSYDYLFGSARRPHSGTATFDNTFTHVEEKLDAEGNDVVYQLNQGDKLQFNITEAVALKHMDTSLVDYNSDGVMDTQINFSGDGAIVLLNQQFDNISALLGSGYVDLLAT